jgi:hypothetical protein
MAKKDQIISLFESYLDLASQLTEANATVKDLKDRKEKAEEALSMLIPAGQSVSGIRHDQKEQKNPPPYAKILESVRSTLIPKTKQAEVDSIIASMTSARVVDSFKKEP